MKWQVGMVIETTDGLGIIDTPLGVDNIFYVKLNGGYALAKENKHCPAYFIYGIKHDYQVYSNKTYWFKSTEKLNIGDRVLLDTVYGMVLGTVVKDVDLNDPHAQKCYKYVISKVDDSGYKNAMEKQRIKSEIESLEKKLASLKEKISA